MSDKTPEDSEVELRKKLVMEERNKALVEGLKREFPFDYRDDEAVKRQFPDLFVAFLTDEEKANIISEDRALREKIAEENARLVSKVLDSGFFWFIAMVIVYVVMLYFFPIE